MKSWLLKWPVAMERHYIMLPIPLFVGAMILFGTWQWEQKQIRRDLDWHKRAGECNQLGQSIISLRQQPRLFEERVIESHALATYLENAAARSGMQVTHIASIQPDHPRRVKDTDYVETLTRVRTTNVTIEQLSKLVWYMQQDVRGLEIPILRMWAPSDESTVWESELVLAGLSYIPQQ